jgi:tetratricopeptide (TPR) repeat protein
MSTRFIFSYCFTVILFFSIGLDTSLAQELSALQAPASAYQNFQQGEAFYLKGEFKQAIPLLAKAEKSYGNNYNGKVMANALHSLALLQDGKKEKAYFSFYEVGEAIVDTQKNILPEAKVALNYCISRYHWSYNERKEALAVLQNVKKNIANSDNKLPQALQIEINQYLGEIANEKGDYEQALEYYQSATEIAEKLPSEKRNQETFSEDNLLIGELREKLIEPDSAIYVYKNILTNKEAIIPDDPKKEIELSFRLGNLYFKQKQYELALPYFQQTISAI